MRRGNFPIAFAARPMRKPYIAGNWKMNLDRKSAVALAGALRERVGRREDVDVAVFPPFVYIDDVARALRGSPIRVGAQNCSDQAVGAFTGEVSAAMLLDIGAEIVILGHSERRHVYGESNELVNRKVHAAVDAGLDAIVCVGETLAEREAQRTEHVVAEQLTTALEGLDAQDMRHVTVAYEPVWAIGTGRNATPAQAGEVHAYLRGVIAGLFADPVAESTRIQYGGSVKPANVRDLMAVPDVDGCLVGGASLQADTFLPLIEAR
jgi:triosephosphate isomerase